MNFVTKLVSEQETNRGKTRTVTKVLHTPTQCLVTEQKNMEVP